MAEETMTQPLPSNHALYGVTTHIIEHADDAGLLPSHVEFRLPPDAVPSGEDFQGSPVVGELHFQNGPIREAGVNGIGIEHLLYVVRDRLRGYQETEFKCRENALALTKVEEAIHWLEHRTRDRQARGVEGTNQK